MGDDLVTRPSDYYPGITRTDYAYIPGRGPRSIQSQVVLRPHYDDGTLTTLRNRMFTNPAWGLNNQILMYQAGYLSKNDISGMWGADQQKAYAKMLSDANANYMSMDDFLKARAAMMGRTSGSGSGGYRGAGSGGPSVSTTTQKSYRITSRASAEALLKQTLAKELGREPNEDEITRFRKALNIQERANPTITTTTARTSGSNTSVSSTTKESEVDPMSEAEDYAEKANPSEAHRYQSGQFYNLIAQMVGGM